MYEILKIEESQFIGKNNVTYYGYSIRIIGSTPYYMTIWVSKDKLPACAVVGARCNVEFKQSRDHKFHFVQLAIVP